MRQRQYDDDCLALPVTTRSTTVILALCLLFANIAMATTQTLDSIQVAAEEYVRMHLPTGAKHYVSAARLDPRLRLDACGAPLETFAQNATGSTSARVTVGVRCSATTA